MDTTNNNDDDAKQPDDMDADNDNDDDQQQQQQNASQPQYKYVWQWKENDGSWHDYDATTQLLLDQLAVGNKISIQAGQWQYDITKVTNDKCSQLNTQTNKTREARKSKILIKAALPAHNNGNNWIGHGRYVFMWQFLENDDKWKDLGYAVAAQLEQLTVHGVAKYNFGQYSYTVKKINNDECTQTNDNTNNQRDIRRILFDTTLNKRVVWQFNDDQGGWTSIGNNDLMLKLENLAVGASANHQRGQWKYIVTKNSVNQATQKNTKTQKVRQYRMVNKDKDEMDPNWSSKASTNNSNYYGYQGSHNQQQQQMQFAAYGGLNGLFARIAAARQDDDDDDQPKEIIKLDPNDVQDIIMADDLAELNKQDMMNDNTNNSNNNNNNNTDIKPQRHRLRAIFGKKKKKKKQKGNKVANDSDDEVASDEAVYGDDDNDNDDDEKKEDMNKSERVLMGDDDRNIWNEFCKTMTRDSVQIISIQKIKDNAAKKIVYDALLTAKKEELKDKNIQHIERNLFHGTSFTNIAKIVNNGFNRDFNRHHLYGKGTYFSSLASESAKYCENDNDEDDEQFVMLVCRVIIGEYTRGTHDMDGSSIPYKPDKKTQYESCVNNVNNPTIFVINRDYHAIPTHIIKFKYKK